MILDNIQQLWIAGPCLHFFDHAFSVANAGGTFELVAILHRWQRFEASATKKATR